MTNILILCTGNSARSMLGEALVNLLGGERFNGFSAGSTPRGEPHPMTLVLLKEKGYDTSTLRSKSWDEYAKPGAPDMDVIITVCDSAATENCPYWPGHPVQVHWGLPDPAAIEGDGQRAAFEAAWDALHVRVGELVKLDLGALSAEDAKIVIAGIHKQLS